jgi:hypothetical protein
MEEAPTQAGGLLGPALLLGGRSEATLATVHADAPHLWPCWSRRRERAIPPARSHRTPPADLVELDYRPPSLPGSRLHFQATRRILTGNVPLMLNDRIGGLRRGGST